jgi:PAS domain S-box-containing protein
MIAPDGRPYSLLKSTIDQRAAICEYSPAVTWHDVQVTEGQAGTIGSRTDATARAVIECAADAIVAFSIDRTVMLWNPAAERMFGWAAAEVVGLEPQIIPEELKAEHNAVLERVRGGGQISFATRRICKDSTVIDVRIDTSALTDAAGEVTGWVNVCHQTGEDDVARHYMAERARVVRRLGDVVADMNAQRDLESVLDRIAASLRELTSADAGGFVLIEDDTLRLVSTAGLPARLRGRTATLSTSLVGELMGSGKTVMMATGESGGFRRPDLVGAARAAHDRAQPLARGGQALRRAVRALQPAHAQPRRAGAARVAGRPRRRGPHQRDGLRGSGQAARA